MRTDEPGGPSREDRSRDLDDIVAEYADRINAGETIRPEDILAEHPALCVEILDQLQAFVSVRQPADGGRELGTLGDYTLRRQIGRGGMGVVYEAWENSMDRRVALKVLPAAVAVDNRALLRFLREARTAGQLAHPSVVPVYALGVKDQTPYYAMELVDGETLAQILRSLKGAEPDAATPFGRKDDLRYFMNIAESFAEVAEGLQHAHSKGVVHRDIKPSNLILDRAANPAGGGFPGCAPGRLRILDFGLAHLEGQASLTLSGDLVGTVLYMSPEQARRRKDPVDARSDVYSLGATLYELLASRPPFLGRDHQETLSQIIEKEPVRPAELNPRVPRDLETVVLKCLEKDRMDRYRTAEALAQDLRRFVRGDPVEARAHPRWERIARRIWKQRLKIIVASLLLLLLAAVVVLLVQVWWDGYRQRRADYAPAVNAAVQMVYFGGSSARMGLERGRRFDPGGFFVGEEEPAGSASPLRQAVEKLERLALDVPERPDAWYHKARGLLLLGRDEEALVALDRAIAADPEFVPAFILKAAIFEKQREEDLAHGELERAERAAVSEWARDLIAAYRAVEALDWEAAAQSFGRVVDGETLEIARGGRERYVGSLAETHISRGVAHFKRREFTTAGMDFWVAKAFWRDALDPILLLGETLILDGKKETAEEILDAFYRRTERKDESALAISVRLFYLGQHERGLRWADRVQDEVVRTRARMAHLYLMWRSAEATLEAREVPAGMDDARFCGNLALACVRQKELAAARSLFLRAVRLEPRNALMWRALGALSTAAGDFDAAREQFERSLSFTEVPPTQFYLAEALFIMGDFQGAEAQFRRAAAIFSRWGFPDIRIHGAIGDLVVGRNHGALLEHMGKPREALEEYLKVLDGLPGEMWIHERLASLLRSEVSAEFWAAVDAWIEPARNGPPPPGASSDATPPDPPWCAAAALALAHHPTAPDAGKALEHARLAVEMTRGNHAGLLATLAEVEEACGDLPAAVAALERAAALPEADVSLAAALASSRRRLAPGLASFATLDAFIGDGGVEILVPEDAEWAFLRGLASPPEGLEWTRADFDDSGWERGKSPLGYGLAYFCSTRIDGMAGAYPCVYVRKLFDAADPGAFRELRLEVWADNGFVAYLNGAEVACARLETPDDEKIFAWSPAHGQPHARPLPYAVRIDASRLSAGANCLALRGVNHSASQQGFYLQALLVGDLKPDARRARELLAELRRVPSPGEEGRARILYAEARALEIEERLAEAAETFREVCALAPDEPLAHLRLARALRSAGRSAEAESALRAALPRFPDRRDLWDLWHEVAALDLGLSAADMLSLISADAASRPAASRGLDEGYGADVFWVLSRLSAEGAIRINCGGGEHTDSTEALWGRDRFFLRGQFRIDWGEIAQEDLPIHRARRAFLDFGELTGRYRIPLPPGEYRVSLHFTERTLLNPGHRIFDVRVEGETFLEAYEPLSAGFARSDVRTWSGDILDGFLDVMLVARADEAEICAIAVERTR